MGALAQGGTLLLLILMMGIMILKAKFYLLIEYTKECNLSKE